jgi:mono/diheme cytochrome c family protein
VRTILALAAFLAPTVSFGQCRTQYATSYASTNYAQTYYQTPALVAVLPAIFVPTASYTVGVSAPVVTPTATSTVTTTKTDSIVASDVGLAMLSELKAMRAEAKASSAEIKSMLQGSRPPAKMPVGEPTPPPIPKVSVEEQQIADRAIAILKKPIGDSHVSCATCHNPTGKNGGFIAFDANLEYTGMKDEEEALRVAKKVAAERVCPKAPGALKGEDKAAVLKGLPPLPVEKPAQGLIRPRQAYLARQ